MPFKDRRKHVEYQRNWIARRRLEYFEGKSCVTCGSTQNLELDHIEPSTKRTHRIWSSRAELRNEEISKCQILCRPCHHKKTGHENARRNIARSHRQK